MRLFSSSALPVLAFCAVATGAATSSIADVAAAIPERPVARPPRPVIVGSGNNDNDNTAGAEAVDDDDDKETPNRADDDDDAVVDADSKPVVDASKSKPQSPAPPPAEDLDLVQALMSELQAMRAERAELATVLQQAQAQIAAAAAATATNDEAQRILLEEQEEEERRRRRRLAASDAYSGLRIKRDNAMIAFGSDSDVVLSRSGAGELNVTANVTVGGNLDASSLSVGGVDILSVQQDQIDTLMDVVDTKANQTTLEALQDVVDDIGGDSWDNQERAGLAMSLCMGAVGSGASNFLSIITVPYDNDAINNWCMSSINGGWKACGVVKGLLMRE